MSRRIVVRYDDASGVGDILGSVAAAAIHVFRLPRMKSNVVTVTVTDGAAQFYEQSAVRPGELVELHYPDDFTYAAPPGSGQ